MPGTPLSTDEQDKSLSADERDFLRMLYEENAEHARTHEELRGIATSLFVALIAGLLAYAVEKGGARQALAGVIICVTSALGALVNLKHHERYQMHIERLKAFKGMLSVYGVRDKIKNLGRNSDTCWENKHPILAKCVRLHLLWLWVYGITGLSGVGVIIVGLTCPQA